MKWPFSSPPSSLSEVFTLSGGVEGRAGGPTRERVE